MSKSKAVRDFGASLVALRLSQGIKVIPRKEIFNSLHREDPRSDYGCGNPFGKDLSPAMLRSIAAQFGGRYVKNAKGKPNARLVFP